MTTIVAPGTFESSQHYYPRVLNAQLHPLVRTFLNLGNDRIIKRYGHLHPEANVDALRSVLETRPRHFRWGGADLFHVTTAAGHRQVVVIETNSCPSGQKSMPTSEDHREDENYRKLIERAFLPMLRRRALPEGGLAVLFDKNEMEASGYAAVMAELTEEPVYLVPCHEGAEPPQHEFVDGVLRVRAPDGAWVPIRGAFRYVTQRPWNRIPPLTKTAFLNPVLVCLAGGRNKLVAAKAYEIFNGEHEEAGLRIRTPETSWGVSKLEVPMWISRLGGFGVVKDPYSNAGQGVYTITSQAELDAFMDLDHRYDRFIVQALIGNAGWSSSSAIGRLYHVGTVPDRKGHIHVADLRFMVGAGADGFFPVAMYARRARSPLEAHLAEGADSWDMLGTNLSYRMEDGSWGTEPRRLLLMDNRDFSRLGLGLDDIIDAYVETVLAVAAIDRMATRMVTQKGKFRRRFFNSLNADETLMSEVMQ